MVIFAALFIVFLGALFRLLSGNQNIDGGMRGNMEAGEVVKPSTPLSSSPKTTKASEYEVFLSFRGEDTRKGFIGHLYEALELHGISTFMDSEKLQKGEEITKLFEYIDRSKIFVPVFSKRFAESRWCLKEVTKSVECGKDIVPVFFGVEPSDVRNQTGPFENAFRQHESDKKMNQEEVKEWREKLKKVGNISGFNLKDMSGDEAKLKSAIVKRVQSKLNKKPLEVAKHPIGIETHVHEVKKMLENGGNDEHHVNVVGILGMGGLGKTTIAKAVYNDLGEAFSGNICFLSNIRENDGKRDGLMKLQKHLIVDILKEKDISLSDVAEGKNLIKQRASRKKVLLILDDVDSKKQLDALAGGRDWFDKKSVIIITTRDERVLRDHNVKEHEIYKPEVLNEDQSLVLFLQHAFNGNEPEGERLQLSNEVVATAGGLPLTIEVLGSLLTCDKDIKEWKDILEKLKRIPPNEVQQRLKLSYDSLDDMEKKIFLDISCFFIDCYQELPTYMWEDCGWFPNAAIGVLKQKSLIKIYEESQFWIHDQIRDMGRAIVKEESSGKLQKQSRIWSYRDYLDLLQKKGKMRTEGIWVSVEEGMPPFSAPRLQEWHDLRLFHIDGATFEGSLHFPEDLKWLGLPYCQLQLPASVSIPKGVVVLDLFDNDDMANVLLDKCGSESMVFDKLKFLDLSCTRITITPDFSSVPCLVELKLRDCYELVEVHESVGQLTSLVRLDLLGCRKLEKLPNSMRKLQFLEELFTGRIGQIIFLDDCDLVCASSLKARGHDFIDTLPDPCCRTKTELELIDDGVEELTKSFTNSFTRFENLESLILKCNSLKALPTGFGRLQLKVFEVYSGNLMLLDDALPLESNEKLVIKCASMEHVSSIYRKIKNLKHLKLDCKNMEVLPDWIESSSKLETLELKGPLKALPTGVGRLQLKVFEVYSDNLMLLDDALPLESTEKMVLKCASLEHVSSFLRKTENLKHLNLDCKNMEVLPDWIESSSKLETLELKGYKKMELKFPPDHLELLSIDFTGSLQQIGCVSTLRIPYVFKKLKILRLVSSPMTITPNFSYFPCLEELALTNCKQLIEVNESIGILKKLNFLKITGCNMLGRLPESICELASLEILDLKGCTSLSNLPKTISHLHSLRELHVIKDKTSKFIMSLGRLEASTSWELMDALPRSCCESVRYLDFTNESIEELTDSIGRFINLESMRLRCKMLKALPDLIGKLKYLRNLRIQCHTLTLFDKICMLENIESLTVECINLEPLPFSSSTTLLRTSTAKGCKNRKQESKCFWDGSSERVLKKFKHLELCAKQITVTPDFSVAPSLETITLKYCEMLTEIHYSIGTLVRLRELNIRGCNALERLPNTICRLTSLRWLQVTQEFNPSSPPEPSGDLDNHGLPETGIFKSILTCTRQLTQLHSIRLLKSCPSWVDLKGVMIDSSSLVMCGLCLELVTCLSPRRLQLVTRFFIKDDEIEELPGYPLQQMEYLKELRLESKSLKALPKWIAQLKRLSKFEVYSDNLMFFYDICSWENIRILKVRCLEFDPVLSSFRKPENLMELTLECESLKALPMWIGKLENLSLLKLECLSLETLPDCIASLGGLQTLQISGCKNIKDLPDSMRQLERLTSLDLSRTGIGEIPPWLGCFRHLTSLKLSDLENDRLLSILSQLPSLEMLDLSESNFRCLPLCISNLSRLKVLDVSRCKQLLSIPHLSNPVLEELHVSGCKELHSILPLNSSVLSVLDASNCTNLKGLPDFSNFRFLRRLWLGGCNSLESIYGFKTITGNIKGLHLPGPSGVIQCSNLSDDFRNKAFVGASFRYLQDFRMTGNVTARSHPGQQYLSFLFPDLRCNLGACMCLGLTFDGISSPVHVAVMHGDRVLFETTLAEDEFYKNGQGSRTFSFEKRDEIFEYLEEGAATILVSTDVSNLSSPQLCAWMH